MNSSALTGTFSARYHVDTATPRRSTLELRLITAHNLPPRSSHATCALLSTGRPWARGAWCPRFPAQMSSHDRHFDHSWRSVHISCPCKGIGKLTEGYSIHRKVGERHEPCRKHNIIKATCLEMGDKRTCRATNFSVDVISGRVSNSFARDPAFTPIAYGNTGFLCCLNNRIHTLPSHVSGSVRSAEAPRRCLDGKPMIPVNISNNEMTFQAYLFRPARA